MSDEQGHDPREIKQLLQRVQDYAEKNRFGYIVPEMMLLALLKDDKCANMVNSLANDKNAAETIWNEMDAYINSVVDKTERTDDIIATTAYSNLIQASITHGGMRGIDADSLCVFIMQFSDKSNAAIYFLSKHGIYEDNVRDYISKYRQTGADPNGKGGCLSKYAVDLTGMAREGKIDPLVGREREIKRITQVLNRRRGSNVVLVGDAGSGKSSIVEGLALDIVAGAVPDSLANKTIYALNMTSMVAGTKYRGEFEERLERLLKEVSGRDDVILFIDELHTIVGAGSSEGAMDCSNILKPYLSRGELHIIGATTYDEYKNKIEKDKALCRRFKKIDVCEPSVDETMLILQGLRPKYEEYHGIRYSDEILRHIIELSGRYIIGKCFPDKAVDVMDEIGASYRSGLKNGTEATMEDVEQVICSIANLPSISVNMDEKERLKTLADRMKQNLFGQDDIIDKVCRQIRMAKAGLQNINKPLSIIEIGSSGTGKTEFARTLASELGIGFTKIDMSEYQEEYSVSKLIGASAGYVGYDQAGALTEPLIKNPHQVILLDEIEKANHSVYDLLLQVMDDGKLTDNHGREATFKNAIIIMTSNVGCANADQMSSSVGFVKSSSDSNERKQKAIEDAFKKRFSPEFRNRLTDVFYFRQLTDDVMEKIVDKNIRRIETALKDKNVHVVLHDGARKMIASMASSEHAGGRPVERIVNAEISERVADEVLFGSLSENGGIVNVMEKDGKIELEFENADER